MIEGLKQKNISLSRGIVRTPSIGEDGELSECVNLIPHAGEIVRIKEPQPIMEEVTDKYIFYTLVWNKAYPTVIYMLTSQKAPAWVAVKVKLKGKDEQSFTYHTGSTYEEFVVTGLTSLEDIESIESIEVGGKEFAEALGDKTFRAHKLFEFPTKADVVFPSGAVPMTLQAGELLLVTNRCEGVENLIVRSGNCLVYYRPGEGRHVITELVEGEVEVVTIGVTLVVTQGITKRYFIWDTEKGEYKEHDWFYILPDVTFELGDTVQYTVDATYLETGQAHRTTFDWSPEYDDITWTTNYAEGRIYFALFKNYATEEEEREGYNRAAKSMYAHYHKIRNEFKTRGMACFPFFIRWGIKLYDGSVINLSAPMIVMPTSIIKPSFGICAGGKNTDEYGGRKNYVVGATPLLTPRYFYACIDAANMEGIDVDLVQGIVIYATPEIEMMDPEPPLKTEFSTPGEEIVWRPIKAPLEDGLGWKHEVKPYYSTGVDIPENPTALLYFDYLWTPPTKKDVDERELTDPNEFYELCVVPLKELKNNNYKMFLTLSDGLILDFDRPGNYDGQIAIKREDFTYTEITEKGYIPYRISESSLSSLSSQSALSDVPMAGTSYIVEGANTAYQYNSRIFYGGVSLKHDLNITPKQVIVDSRTRFLRPQDNPGSPVGIYAKFDKGYFTIGKKDDFLQGFRGEVPFLALPYRDALSLALGEDYFGSAIAGLTFQKNSLSGCAIWTEINRSWLENATDLKDKFLSMKGISLEDIWRSNTYKNLPATLRPNTVAYTKVGNPWVIEKVEELACGEIYALSSATEAVSEGQFGEYPLYAFTDDGIYALSLTDEGGIAAKQPISRDVLTKGGDLLQLDRALVFPTEAGLKLLSKPPTQTISKNLSGLNVDEDMFGIQGIKDILPFEEQIKGADMVYDYAHSIVHVFNDKEKGDELVERDSWEAVDGEAIHTGETTLNNEALPLTVFATLDNGTMRVNGIGKPEGSPIEFEGQYMPVVIELKAGDKIYVDQFSHTGTKTYYVAWGNRDNLVPGAELSYQEFALTGPYAVVESDAIMLWGDKVYPSKWRIVGTRSNPYPMQNITPITEQIRRQKHYVYDLESGQWATQILDKQLTTCVAGYPFSTMQFGRELMQYNNELEADVLREGWLLTRPIHFDNPFTRKMLYDLRILKQKTNPDTEVKVQVYVSNDRQNWARLTSLKGRSAKWYRFLIKAKMTGLDTLSGIACQYVERLTEKMR